jgi:hypothetical protein
MKKEPLRHGSFDFDDDFDYEDEDEDDFQANPV